MILSTALWRPTSSAVSTMGAVGRAQRGGVEPAGLGEGSCRGPTLTGSDAIAAAESVHAAWNDDRRRGRCVEGERRPAAHAARRGRRHLPPGDARRSAAAAARAAVSVTSTMSSAGARVE